MLSITRHRKCEKVVTALCSEGPLFRRFYIHKVLCSEGPLFRRSYVQKVLCSEGSIFWRFYVQKVLCSEIFVQKVLCLESTGDYLSVAIGHMTLNQRQWRWFDVAKTLFRPTQWVSELKINEVWSNLMDSLNCRYHSFNYISQEVRCSKYDIKTSDIRNTALSHRCRLDHWSWASSRPVNSRVGDRLGLPDAVYTRTSCSDVVSLGSENHVNQMARLTDFELDVKKPQ